MNLKNRLLSSSRIAKQILVALTDFISFTFSVYLASLVSNLEFTQLVLNEIFRLLWIPAFSVFIFYLFGVYRSVLRYIDFALIYLLFKAIITAFVLNFVLHIYFDQKYDDTPYDIGKHWLETNDFVGKSQEDIIIELLV